MVSQDALPNSQPDLDALIPARELVPLAQAAWPERHASAPVAVSTIRYWMSKGWLGVKLQSTLHWGFRCTTLRWWEEFKAERAAAKARNRERLLPIAANARAAWSKNRQRLKDAADQVA